MICTQDLTFEIGEFRLDAVSIEMLRNEYFVLLGPLTYDAPPGLPLPHGSAAGMHRPPWVVFAASAFRAKRPAPLLSSSTRAAGFTG